MKIRINLYKLLLYGLILTIFLSLIFSAFVFSLENSTNKIKQTEVVTNEKQVLVTQNFILTRRMDVLVADLMFLASTYQEFFIKDYPYNDLDDDWIVYSNQMKYFDKIRFIDLAGNEKLRINYSDSTGAYMVEDALLENKSKCKLFQRCHKFK